MKKFTDEEIKSAVNKAPKIIRDELDTGYDTAVTISEIGRNQQMHIDQIGILAELNRNMLLGLIGPSDFSQELTSIGISDAQVQQILSEINTKIFIPLREEMRRADTAVAQPPRSAPPAPRVAAINASVPSYAPPQRPVASAPMSIPPTRTPTSAPSQSRQAQQSSVASLPPRFGASRPVLTALPRPEAEPMMLEDHEEPHIDFHTAPIAAPVARTAPPPDYFPGAMPPVPAPDRVAPVPPREEAPVISPPPVTQSPVTPTPAPVAPARPPYSADPYREPIES